MLVAGLISGTSLDGIDVALTDVFERAGRLQCELRAFETVAYPAQLRAALFELLEPAAEAAVPLRTLRDLSALNFAVGEAFAHAAQSLIAASPAKPQLIASHGQTVYHLVAPDGRQPYAASTLQIGEPAVIAERTGITCVADFRVADVAAGGQGAPLVSYADQVLLGSAQESRGILNIGGIANVTLMFANAPPPRAFDTGPGNMLIDRAVRTLFDRGAAYDNGGAIAKRGNINDGLLQWLLADPYFERKPPKTTGHEQFGANFYAKAWSEAQARQVAPDDFVATLTALTAATIAAAIPEGIERIIVSGGGARNVTLLEMLSDELRRSRAHPPALSPSDAFGIPTDAKEAMAFALLGFEALRGQPNNLPACTGARHATILGKIVPGANYASLMCTVWQADSGDRAPVS